MISSYLTKRNKDMLLKAVYEKDVNEKTCSLIAKQANFITEFFDKNEAYIFISKEVKNYYDLLKVIDSIILSERRNY